MSAKPARIVLAALAAGLLPVRALALDLPDAILRAQAQHPTVAAARTAVAQAEAGVGEAGAARYPRLDFTTRASEHQEPMLVTPIHGFRPNLLPPFSETLLQSSLDLRYPVLDGGTRGARIDQARAHQAAAEAEVEAAAQQLTATVVATYLRVLSAQEILAAHAERVRALHAEDERVRDLKSAGRAAEIDVLRIEAALASAAAEGTRFTSAMDVAERQLARLIGADPIETRAPALTKVALADTLLGERSALLQSALSAAPDVAAARRRQEAAAAAVDAAKGERWPQIDLGASLQDWRDDGGNHSTEWQAGVRLNQALFTGGAIKERIAGAAAESDRARETLRLAELQIGDDLDRALGQVHEAHALVESLERARDRFAEVARIERIRLTTGPGTQIDYLAAEADLLQARARLAEAEHGEIAARVELARVTGELDSDWITGQITVQENSQETPR